MKKRFVIIYSIFIVLIYLLALFNFGFTLYTEYANSMADPLYIFSTEKILSSLEKSFFVILFATILTFIILFFSYKSYNTKKVDSKDSNENDETEEDDQIIEEEQGEEDDSNEIDNSEIEIIDESTSSEESEIEIEEEALENNQEIENNEDSTEETSDEETKNVEVVLPSEEIKPIQSESSVHIFSPKTGFCFESYLESRLDNELNRAIASEFDLSLFVFRIPSIQLEHNNETLQKVCKYLTTEFQFKDLLFEYDEDCLIGIKNNMNLDTALTFADKLYSDITEIVKENDLKCYIGISTRTVRIITGKRLLTEATEALKHALEDENNPIIAFRANAEKYRKMMQEK